MEVTIKSDTGANQRSDEHLLKVAETVGQIVGDIVLSDDGNQLCWAALQSQTHESQKKELVSWYLKTLNNQSGARREYVAQLKNEIQVNRKRAAAQPANAADKAEIEKRAKELLKKLEEESKGMRAYTYTPIAPLH